MKNYDTLLRTTGPLPGLGQHGQHSAAENMGVPGRRGSRRGYVCLNKGGLNTEMLHLLRGRQACSFMCMLHACLLALAATSWCDLIFAGTGVAAGSRGSGYMAKRAATSKAPAGACRRRINNAGGNMQAAVIPDCSLFGLPRHNPNSLIPRRRPCWCGDGTRCAVCDKHLGCMPVKHIALLSHNWMGCRVWTRCSPLPSTTSANVACEAAKSSWQGSACLFDCLCFLHSIAHLCVKQPTKKIMAQS